MDDDFPDVTSPDEPDLPQGWRADDSSEEF